MRRTGLLVVPALLIALAGCGDGDSEGDGEGASRDPASTTSVTASDAAVPHPCDVLTAAEVTRIVGSEVDETRIDPNGESSGVCAYLDVGDGVNAALFGLGRGSLAELVASKNEEGLDVTDVEVAGYDEAARVVDPADPAHVDLYLGSDAASFRLTVTTDDETLSRDLSDTLASAMAP